jgi:uncharacterized protein YozE (UPF0346 family)
MRKKEKETEEKNEIFQEKFFPQKSKIIEVVVSF